MIPKTVPKIFLIFFFLLRTKISLVEWPSGCLGSDGNWYCSCDSTYCGFNCVGGDVTTNSTTALRSAKDALGRYSCMQYIQQG